MRPCVCHRVGDVIKVRAWRRANAASGPARRSARAGQRTHPLKSPRPPAKRHPSPQLRRVALPARSLQLCLLPTPTYRRTRSCSSQPPPSSRAGSTLRYVPRQTMALRAPRAPSSPSSRCPGILWRMLRQPRAALSPPIRPIACRAAAWQVHESSEVVSIDREVNRLQRAHGLPQPAPEYCSNRHWTPAAHGLGCCSRRQTATVSPDCCTRPWTGSRSAIRLQAVAHLAHMPSESYLAPGRACWAALAAAQGAGPWCEPPLAARRAPTLNTALRLVLLLAVMRRSPPPRRAPSPRAT